MAALGAMLTNPSLPPNVTSTGSSSTTLPGSITGFENNVAGPLATQVATSGFTPYTGQLTAGPNANMTGSYNLAPGNVGAYQPYLGAASGALNQIMPQTGQQKDIANSSGALGVAAAYDPSNSWGAQANNWMNPYTSNVVDQIAKAGNQNFETQLMPAINSQFIGSGDFNSLSNMGGLSMGAGLAQQGITSAQSAALQQGYGQGLQGYLADLAQKEAAAGQAGNLANQSGYMANYGSTGAASGYGGLGQQASTLGWGDVSNLYGSGAPFQQLGQSAINAQLNENFNPYRTWQNQQLGAATGAMSQLPWAGTVSGTINAPLPGAGYGPSPIGQAGAIAGGLSALGGLYPGASNAISGGLNSAANWLTGGGNTSTGSGASDFVNSTLPSSYTGSDLTNWGAGGLSGASDFNLGF